MDAERVLALRYARSGLAGRVAGTWRLRKGEVEVEQLGRSRLPGLDDEIERVLAAVS